MSPVAARVTDLIGRTPLVDVSRLSPNPRVRLLAKLESHNPFGSVKDRVALAMVDEAERNGRLRHGRMVVEPSSGNTGIALAAIGRVRGFSVTVVMPDGGSIERRLALAVLGAELILTPAAEGTAGAIGRARVLAGQGSDRCLLNQYENDATVTAHEAGTGPEIAHDCPDVTHFVAGVGTAGTLLGVGRFLKTRDPRVQVVAVEPESDARIEGLRNLDAGFTPPLFRKWRGDELVDRRMAVCSDEAFAGVDRLATCGIFAGPSSGALLAGAVRTATEVGSGVVVFIVCDGGWKYLSHRGRRDG